ncbi:MAG: glycosyltransferase [Actinomycetota bacterium]|jgi:GT2 family glycosyltransferase|nr:glycosyltransferase [Actinomycetota bacterium]
MNDPNVGISDTRGSPGRALPEQPSLRVQTVLFNHDARDVTRFVHSICAAGTVARRRGALGRMVLALGDSSPAPLLDRAMENEHRRVITASGFDSYEYLSFGENLGSAGGHNVFLGRQDMDLTLVINPDAYASPELIVELVSGIRDRDVGIVEARQAPMEHPKEFDRTTGDTAWASGACFLVRREVLCEIDGFDSHTFFLYCDDVDFSWRARLAGFRVVYHPPAVVYHDKRLDRDGQMIPAASEVYFSAEASLMMAWKYSRPDLADQWSRALLATTHATHQRAVFEFRRRMDEHTLPTPLDPEGTVADFVGDTYGPHRFKYDD